MKNMSHPAQIACTIDIIRIPPDVLSQLSRTPISVLMVSDTLYDHANDTANGIMREIQEDVNKVKMGT